MRVIKIKNDSGVTQTILGKVVNDQGVTTIDSYSKLETFRKNEILVQLVATQELIVQDEDGDITDSAKAMEWLYADNPSEVKIKQADSDTGGLATSPKYAPDGWRQQMFEVEFETSNSDPVKLHEKDYMNQDIGWSTLKFYKDDNGTEVECTDQADIDANCTRTDIEWMPNIDYMIKGGFIGQITVPPQDVYVWVQGAVLPDAYGGPQSTFAEGGINMAYVAPQARVGLDGVAGTILYYEHPQLGPGLGTNKIRFVCRHSAGFKHRFQVIFDIFRG